MNIDELRVMPLPQLIDYALTMERDWFWLVAGMILSRISKTEPEISQQLWDYGHAAPVGDYAAAIAVLRSLRAKEADPCPH